MVDYQGAVTLVTGGASGIGRALAAALLARGAQVMLADVNADLVRETAAELGHDTRAVACDLADPDAPKALINEAFAWRGRLDLVCSNAGIGHRRRLLKTPLDADVERLFAVNLFAALRIAQAYGGALEAAGARGRLMITGSENSLSLPAAVKRRRIGLYGASKHGVLIMAEWLREELEGDLMDLHVLLPGAVYTPLIAAGLPDPAMAPPEVGLIMPERCAEIALRGIDLGLFYIPTHAHIADDMAPRTQGVVAALQALGLRD